MSYLTEQKRTLSFRRLPFAAKRRRARPFLSALRRAGKVCLVMAPLLVAAVWLLGSNQFGVSEVETVGAAQVDPAWVEQQLIEEAGRNLFRLDLEDVQARLSAHPWVSSLRIEKQLPRRLVVTVDEHVPAAVLIANDGHFLISEQGDRIIQLDPSLEQSYQEASRQRMVIDGRSGPQQAIQLERVIALARHLESSGTSWARAPQTARILSPEDLEFAFRDTRFVVRLRQSQTPEVVERQVATVDDLLPQLEDRLGEIQAIDLRFERRIVLAPVNAVASSRVVPASLPSKKPASLPSKKKGGSEEFDPAKEERQAVNQPLYRDQDRGSSQAARAEGRAGTEGAAAPKTASLNRGFVEARTERSKTIRPWMSSPAVAQRA